MQHCKTAGITSNSMAKLGRDESVTLESFEKIWNLLECNSDNINELGRNGPK